MRKLITDAQWQLADVDEDGAAPQATLKFEQMAQQGAQGWRASEGGAGVASWLRWQRVCLWSRWMQGEVQITTMWLPSRSCCSAQRDVGGGCNCFHHQ